MADVELTPEEIAKLVKQRDKARERSKLSPGQAPCPAQGTRHCTDHDHGKRKASRADKENDQGP